MAKIVWNSGMATGERSIDLQHQDLIDIANELDQALMADAATDALRAVLQRLNHYVLFHFAHEEALMRTHNVEPAHVEAHLHGHADFAHRVAQAMAALNDNTLAPVEHCQGLMNYLVGWLSVHIMKVDKALALLLRTPAKRDARQQAAFTAPLGLATVFHAGETRHVPPEE